MLQPYFSFNIIPSLRLYEDPSVIRTLKFDLLKIYSNIGFITFFTIGRIALVLVPDIEY